MSSLFMRATTERTYDVIDREDGTFSGIEYVNHPPPSGHERWLPTIEDNRKWDTEEKAIKHVKKLCMYLDIVSCETDLAGDRYRELVEQIYGKEWEELKENNLDELKQDLSVPLGE